MITVIQFFFINVMSEETKEL